MIRIACLPIAVFVIAAAPASAASGCDGVIAAILKVYQVPTHMYMTETGAATGGRTRNAETIYLNGSAYVTVNGPWRKSPISPKDLEEMKKESVQKSTCAMVRDEAVNGESATLYKAHSQNPDGSVVDTQIWVSNSKGLPVKQINDIVVGGAAGKTHTEVRYEYSNVTAPAVSEPHRK